MVPLLFMFTMLAAIVFAYYTMERARRTRQDQPYPASATNADAHWPGTHPQRDRSRQHAADGRHGPRDPQAVLAEEDRRNDPRHVREPAREAHAE